MELPRRAGILLHITSLPGGPHTGDLGPSAYAFVDFLKAAGQAWWQTLPLNPIDGFGSPYSSVSAFAGEPLMISPEELAKEGLLRKGSLRGLPARSKTWKAGFASSRRVRTKLLRQAYERYLTQPPPGMRRALASYRRREREWIDDYALFRALQEEFGTADWPTWPRKLARRNAEALEAARIALAGRIHYFVFEQFLFDRQWSALRKHCRRKGVGIIGDVPMFVSHQSADVWTHPEAFLLYDNGRPRFVAGAPPDAFNANGQRWGNALYDWPVHDKTGFTWWKARIRRQLSLFDLVRLDHFIGFRRYWRVPARARSAKSGRWIPAPGGALLHALQKNHGALPFLAEDLGAVTQEVWDLRDQYRLPGMTVLQFAFGDHDGNRLHRPHTYSKATVAFTGTHDSNTMLGWYRDLRRAARSHAWAKADLARAQAYLGVKREDEIVDASVRAIYASPADTAIVPMQDVLRLDGRHRMNRPGVARGNWAWRLKDGELGRPVAARLRQLAEVTDRLAPD